MVYCGNSKVSGKWSLGWQMGFVLVKWHDAHVGGGCATRNLGS